MANLAIAHPLISDAGSIEGVGSEAASMEAVNLLNKQPTDIWRATDLNNSWFEMDLGSAKEIDLIAIMYTNATSSATIRVRAATTQGNLTTVPGYDSGVLSHWPSNDLDNWLTTHRVIYLPTSETYRWWRIDVDDSGNPDNYYQAGRFYLSKVYQPTSNIDYGWGLGWEDNSPIQRGGSNSLYPDIKDPYRVLSFSLSYESFEDMYGKDGPFEIDMIRGSSRDVLVVVKPDDADWLQALSVYGLMTELSPVINRNFDLYQKRYVLEEML